MEQNQVAQNIAANNLSSATYLLNFLIRLWTDMVDEEFKVLENAISPVISDSTDQVGGGGEGVWFQSHIGVTH